MARGKFLTVFCYDVSLDSTRSRVAKTLEEVACRVQYSVFETRMTEVKANITSQHIASLLGDGDSLRVYVIGSNGEKRTRVYGDGAPIQTDEGYWLL